jgi:curved DNA-binding protein CbpA
MAETFYTVLGVDPDAERSTIEVAYRDLAKEYHPDVNEAADAAEIFQRLATAKGVLVDVEERARYDRLGHTRYVARHLDGSVWCDRAAPSGQARGTSDPRDGPTTNETAAPNGTDTSDDGARSTSGATTSAASATATNYERYRADGRTAHHRERWLGDQSIPAWADGETEQPIDEAWQRAADHYRSTEAAYEPPGFGQSVATSARESLSVVGPWLLVHAIFLASAFLLGMVLFTSTRTLIGDVGFLLWMLLIAVAVLLSVIHLVSELFG